MKFLVCIAFGIYRPSEKRYTVILLMIFQKYELFPAGKKSELIPIGFAIAYRLVWMETKVSSHVLLSIFRGSERHYTNKSFKNIEMYELFTAGTKCELI